MSKCANHLELSRKIHLRWYLTPVRIAHMSPSASKSCWRTCGSTGTLLHMWWACPVVAPFWTEITTFIQTVSGLQINLTPVLAVLDLGLNDIPSPLRTVIHHIFIAARMTIARLWKTLTTPSLLEITRQVNFAYHSETKLTPYSNLCIKKAKLWDIWRTSKYFS